MIDFTGIPCPPHDFVLHWRMVERRTSFKGYVHWSVCAVCKSRGGFGRGGGVIGGLPCCLAWPHGGIRDELRSHEYDLVGEEVL